MSDSETVNQPPVKRGRGRPRKDPSAAPAKKSAPVNGAPKGKRGRKPGSTKKSTSVAPDSQGVKRGRGRPKKSETEKVQKNKKVKKTQSSESEAQSNSSPEEESDE